MIIRSQDKAFIINFEKVDTVCLGGTEGKSVITFTDAQLVTLGTYSTEEKAIKVLDMICDFAGDKHYEKVVTTQCGCVGGIVFNMPSDEEVEV